MKKTVVLFALAAWTLLAGQDRAVPATSNPLSTSGHTMLMQTDGGGPMPMCPPLTCPLASGQVLPN